MAPDAQLDPEEFQEYIALRRQYGVADMDSGMLRRMATLRVAQRRSATSQSPTETLKAALGVKEKLAAWLLWRWLTKGSGRDVLKKMLGNKWTTAIGIAIGAVVALCQSGVLSPEWCAYVTAALPLLTAMGFVAAKDGSVGSAPTQK